jgi:DNA-binding CsgD family transcriptional regulator
LPSTDATLLDALADLAAPRTLPELRERTVERVADLVSCNVASWNEIDTASGRFDVVAYPQPTVDPGPPTQRMLSLLHEHPVIAHVQATGDGRPYAISDFIDEEVFRGSALYREVYAAIDTVDQLSITLPDPHLLVGIALNRPHAGFADPERATLNALRPHLAHAYRNALAFERFNRALQALERRGAKSGEHVVVLDRHGGVEYHSPGVADLLSHWFGAGVDGSGVLPEALSTSLPPRAHDAPQTPLVLSRDGQTLTVELLGLPGDDGEALLMSATLSVPARLRELGLTPRQVEVLTLAADGLRNAAIAARLGISPRTVEKHLEQVYEQLGTAGRVAAVRLVHRIAAPPSI